MHQIQSSRQANLWNRQINSSNHYHLYLIRNLLSSVTDEWSLKNQNNGRIDYFVVVAVSYVLNIKIKQKAKTKNKKKTRKKQTQLH